MARLPKGLVKVSKGEYSYKGHTVKEVEGGFEATDTSGTVVAKSETRKGVTDKLDEQEKQQKTVPQESFLGDFFI
jgi:hypothetical protein